jgi:CBS domain-containing protein
MKISEIIDIDRGLIGPARPKTPVLEANAMMTEHCVGALAVVDSADHLIGIISERDITRGLHEFGAAIAGKVVGELMVGDVISCAPGTDVGYATKLMIHHGFRHLPVLDGDKPLTIVSIRDIVSVHLGSLEIDNESLRA